MQLHKILKFGKFVLVFIFQNNIYIKYTPNGKALEVHTSLQLFPTLVLELNQMCLLLTLLYSSGSLIVFKKKKKKKNHLNFVC